MITRAFATVSRSSLSVFSCPASIFLVAFDQSYSNEQHDNQYHNAFDPTHATVVFSIIFDWNNQIVFIGSGHSGHISTKGFPHVIFTGSVGIQFRQLRSS